METSPGTFEQQYALVAIPYPIPLSARIPDKKVLFVNQKIATEKTECEALSEPAKATCLARLAPVEANCTGTVEAPTAANGYLCVYGGNNPTTEPFGVKAASGRFLSVEGEASSFNPSGDPAAGIVIVFPPIATGGGPARGSGSYAVTAP